MSWDKIWINKGLEDTNNLNQLSGFNLHYEDSNISLNHVNLIIDNCKILKHEKILEVGCGAGRLAKIFLERDYKYFGIEQSTSLVNKFKILIDNDKVKLMDNNKIPFEDNSFDVVFCYSVVQYLKDINEFKFFLNEMKRVANRIIFLGDLETIDTTKNMKDKYKYDTNDNLKHLCIQKDYFKDIKDVSINNLYCSKNSRYNAVINKNYHTFGFKKIENVFSPEEINNILSNVNIIKNIEDKKDFLWKYFNNENNISRIEYFVNFSDFFKQLSQNEKILNIVNKLMGEESIIFKDKINFKYPNEKGFLPHQDITAGWSNYTNKHITVGIPLCNTNDDNGCLYFSKDKINQQLTENFKDLDLDLEYNPVYTNIGDIVIFDSFIPHKSFTNNTSEERPFIYFTYTPKSEGSYYEKYHQDKFKNVPPDIYREKDKIYRSNFGVSFE